jgi:predicted nucleic acid-binding protein
MNVLVDTNLLLRFVQPAHPMQLIAEVALVALRGRGDVPCIVPQVLYEMWVVSTRPTTVNGRGLTPVATAAELTTIQADFPLLPDTPDILPAWESLVTTYGVVGKTAHDARLVAAMRVHGLTHLLTFNDQDFRRFPAVTPLTPAAVTAPPAP